MKRFAIALFALAATTTPSAAPHDEASIPQQLRDGGSFERVIVTSYEPLQLADLVGRADLIVEATTTGGRSFLTMDGVDIHTDYAFQVHSVYKNTRTPELRLGDTIVVRRDSGTIAVDGRVAVTQENDFPLFDRSERYMLFLNKSREGNLYVVFGGPQGAFSLRDNVKQVSTELGDWSNRHTGVTRAAFVDELRALLKFSS